MKKIILIFGLIAGLICGGMFFLNHPSDGQMDFENGMLYGYITMIIALSSIFFATKQYRDKYNDGTINFKKAFQLGMGITVIATIVYVLCWEIYYTNFASDFGDQYIAHLEGTLKEAGKSAEAIKEELASTSEMMESYSKNRLMRMGLTATEILPVGVIITLIASILFGKVWNKA